MTDDKLIEWAVAAAQAASGEILTPEQVADFTPDSDSMCFLRTLVELARADEREACAEITDTFSFAVSAASAIRARGNK